MQFCWTDSRDVIGSLEDEICNPCLLLQKTIFSIHCIKIKEMNRIYSTLVHCVLYLMCIEVMMNKVNSNF